MCVYIQIYVCEIRYLCRGWQWRRTWRQCPPPTPASWPRHSHTGHAAAPPPAPRPASRSSTAGPPRCRRSWASPMGGWMPGGWGQGTGEWGASGQDITSGLLLDHTFSVFSSQSKDTNKCHNHFLDTKMIGCTHHGACRGDNNGASRRREGLLLLHKQLEELAEGHFSVLSVDAIFCRHTEASPLQHPWPSWVCHVPCTASHM